MPILKNWFKRVKEAIKRAFVDRPTRMRQAAQEVGDILYLAVLERQPVGQLDSWDQRTTSSERQGHTAISAGWGEGPEVFHRSEEGVDVVLSNVSEHVLYFVWTVGGVQRSHLGTQPHRIPLVGMAKEVYGHPLAFWWEKENRPEVRWSHVDHPGMEELRQSDLDFVQLAWLDIEDEALPIIRQAARTTAFDALRRLWT